MKFFIKDTGKLSHNFEINQPNIGELLTLILGLFLVNIFSIRNDVIPAHDTSWCYQIFYFFYNEIMVNKVIPQWNPFVAYGQPFYFTYLSFTPSNFLIAFIGWVFNVKNTLLLFKATLLLEQAILLIGIYYLSLKIYKHRLTAIFACIASSYSIVWIYQPAFNLRILYLLPTLLYWTINFFEKKNLNYILMIGLLFIFWSFGTLYLLIIPIATFFIFFITVALHTDKIFPLKYNKITYLLLILLISIIFLLINFYVSISSQIILSPHGGRTSDGINSLSTFLTYGGIPSFNQILQGYLFGLPFDLPYKDAAYPISLYSGIIVVFYFIYAIVSKGLNNYSKFFLLIIIVLTLFAMGGIVSTLFYFIPGINFYRHIGLIHPFIKIFICLVAAFGFDKFNYISYKKTIIIISAILLLSEIALAGSEPFLSQIPISTIFSEIKSIRFFIYVNLITKILILSLIIILIKITLIGKINIFKITILSFLALDIFSYQYYVYKFISPKFHTSETKILEKAISLRPYEFSNIRSSPSHPTLKESELFIGKTPGAIYSNAYSFMQIDPCAMDYRNFYYAQAIFSDSILGADYNYFKNNQQYGCSPSKLMIYNEDHIPLQNNVKVLEFNANLLQLEIPSIENIVLTYSDSFSQNWSALLNGGVIQIKNRNGIKEINIPPGNNRIIFQYNDQKNYYKLLAIVIFFFGSLLVFFIYYLIVAPLSHRGLKRH